MRGVPTLTKKFGSLLSTVLDTIIFSSLANERQLFDEASTGSSVVNLPQLITVSWVALNLE